MKPRMVVAGQDAQQRLWIRHHLQAVWPDIDPPLLDPQQLAGQLDTLTLQRCDALLLCARFDGLPGQANEGATWLRALRRRRGLPPIIVIASQGSELAAVRAIRLGAAAYLPGDVLDARLLEGTLRKLLHASQRRRQRAARARGRSATGPARPVLPGYTLLQELGSSNRASVWLARSEELERPVALKIGHPPLPGEAPQPFAAEYAAIGALQHGAVVTIHGHGTHAGRDFIAMEYFPCGDFKQRLQHPITPVQALRYARRIAEALAFVHGAGLVHRDLKPPNIMLRADGSPVLIDFGLARRAEVDTQSTATGILRGSPYYMSPEQAQGLPVDGRSDLYSLGIICFEMLTGRKPFQGESPLELMQQHVYAERPALPAQLAAWQPVVARLMARDADERYGNAREALAALDALAAPEALAMTPGGEAAQAAGPHHAATVVQPLPALLPRLRAERALLGELLAAPRAALAHYTGAALAELRTLRVLLARRTREPTEFQRKLRALQRRCARLARRALRVPVLSLAHGFELAAAALAHVATDPQAGGDEFLPAQAQLEAALLTLTEVASRTGAHAPLRRRVRRTQLLLPPRLKPAGDEAPQLAQALHQLAERIALQEGKRIALTLLGLEHVPEELTGAVFDITTQLLRNAVQHGIEPPARRTGMGKPATGAVFVAFRRLDQAQCELCVNDDGQGLPAGQITAAGVDARGHGLGIVGERLRGLKGRLQVATQPGQSTRLRIRVPWPGAAALPQAGVRSA